MFLVPDVSVWKEWLTASGKWC